MEILKSEINPDCGNLLSIILSNRVKSAKDAEYDKIRIKLQDNLSHSFSTESFKNSQVFHKLLTAEEIYNFLCGNVPEQYKNIIIETKTENLTILTNKKGEKKLLRKKRTGPVSAPKTDTPHNREKNYILKEGNPVPFLVQLGVMTKDGQVHKSHYDKFKQINRFLEFVDDILPTIQKDKNAPLYITDFGCGKSYLTFALYHYLVTIKGLTAHINGLDLKKDVMEHCNALAEKCRYKNLVFTTGDIAKYRETHSGEDSPLDLVLTLHACNTATDYALAYAVEHKAKAILSVPCCQHEINQQLKKETTADCFAAFLKYGIIKDRFAALATDILRSECLEAYGYKTQILEFIDIENTPKNLLIRGVLNKFSTSGQPRLSTTGKALLDNLGVNQTLVNLLNLN